MRLHPMKRLGTAHDFSAAIGQTRAMRKTLTIGNVFRRGMRDRLIPHIGGGFDTYDFVRFFPPKARRKSPAGTQVDHQMSPCKTGGRIYKDGQDGPPRRPKL